MSTILIPLSRIHPHDFAHKARTELKAVSPGNDQGTVLQTIVPSVLYNVPCTTPLICHVPYIPCMTYYCICLLQLFLSSCITLFRTPVGFFSVFWLFRPYADIFFLVSVLFRPCSSRLFLFSTYVVLLAAFLILHHILQNSCRPFFFVFFVLIFLIFLVWLVMCSLTGTLAFHLPYLD